MGQTEITKIVCAKPHLEPSYSETTSSNQEDVLNETEQSTRWNWKQKVLAFYGIVILFCIIAIPRLGGTILSYFTEELKRDVGTTVSQYSVIAGHLNGFISAFFALFWGYCIDRFKWKRTWLLSALLVLLCGMHVLQGLARNFGDLLAATVFIAVGASVHMPLAISLISDLLPARLSLMGQALVFAGESFAVILGGNIAGVLKLRSISWRNSEFGIAIAFLTLALCAFLLPEPISRQYNGASGSGERAPRFVFGAALKYLAKMKSYWILVLGLGLWAAASEIVFSYMPAFQEAQFPGSAKLSGDIGTVIGACALASALLFGAISLRSSKLRSRTLSLASTAGALLGCLFFILALYAETLAGPQHGYILMLVCLGLGALSVQGLIGPMNGELAATLPAHMKNFGLSLYVFFQDLLQPCYVAIMGVGLQSFHEDHRVPVAAVANQAKLTAKSETILSSFGAARTFLTFGLGFNLCLAAILFVAASFNIRKDIRERISSNASLQQARKLSVARAMGLIMFTATFLVFAVILLALTLYSSFHSEGVFHRTR